MIETLTDWNTRLEACGCCEMPSCPEPAVVCENNWAKIDAANDGFIDTQGEGFDPFIDPLYYRKNTLTQSGSDEFGSASFSQIGEISAAFDTTTCSGANTDLATVNATYSGGGSQYIGGTYEVECEEGTIEITVYTEFVWTTTETGPHTEVETQRYYVNDQFCDPDALVIDVVTREWFGFSLGNYFANAAYTETYELPVTWADFLAEIPNVIDSASVGVDEECWYSSTCTASLEVGDPSFDLSIQATALRFRFRVPIAHTGSKFFFTYDIAEFPADGDPSFVSQDNVAEWTGPGTGTQSDPSWLTDWVVIPPPEVAGERRVVNIRYTCYSGTKFGSKPQVMGEVLEIPPP